MFYYLCKVVCTSTSLLYPLYASYKSLRPNPQQSPQEQAERLERWLMYWFPFYHEIKTLAILWLALPQIQGSTYIYIHHLSPFLTSHEQDIDAALTDARTSATRAGLGYANAAVRKLRAAVLGSLLGGGDDNGTAGAAGTGAPPVLAEPGTTIAGNASGAGAAGLAQLAGGLFRTYAPAAIAAGNALLHPMGATPARRRDGPSPAYAPQRERGDDSDGSTSPASVSGVSTSSSSVRSRAHPASLSPASPGGGRADPVAARIASETSLLSASTSFEEIRRDEAAGFPPAPAGAPAGRGARKSGGWFGWGAAEGIGAEKKNA